MALRYASAVPRAGRWALALAVALACARAAGRAQQTGSITGTVTDGQSGAPLGEVQVYLEGTGLGTLSRQRPLPHPQRAGRQLHAASRARRREDGIPAGQRGGRPDGRGEPLHGDPGPGPGRDRGDGHGGRGPPARGGQHHRPDQHHRRPRRADGRRDRPAPRAPPRASRSRGGGGEIGQGKQIRLRGNSSVSMSNQPIIYIDGVRMMSERLPPGQRAGLPGGRGANVTASPLDDINPNDIERIEVIKGSAATTLYGTEASAGVIQIFTKRGSQGAPVWTAETQQGTVVGAEVRRERRRLPEHGAHGPARGTLPRCARPSCPAAPPYNCGPYSAPSVRGGGQSAPVLRLGQLEDEHGHHAAGRA